MFKKLTPYLLTFFSVPTLLLNAAVASNNQNLMQSEIEHVVLLILENRSFDNILAWLYSDEDPPNAFIPQDSNAKFLGLSEDSLGQYTNFLKDSSGDIIFRCAPIKGVPSITSTPYLNSPKRDPHEVFTHVTNQIFGFDGAKSPTMKGFLQDYASFWKENEWLSNKKDICGIMETYTDKELPVLYSLAKQYAVSDLWFSSVPTQTNPNRGFALCGTSDGTIVNGPLGRTIFQSDTLWNRLVEQSPETTWAIFWQTDMLPGIIPGPYSGTNTYASLAKIPGYQNHIQKLDTFHQLAREGNLPNVCLIDPQMNLILNLTPEELLDNKLSDGKEFLIGFEGNDLHPPGDLRLGENQLANIYTSLIANQDAWNKTLFVIIFDEHGGIFDHVPPPAAIPPDNDVQNGFNFDRYGVRIPAIFISPRINKGTVIRSSNPETPFDHTSFIATILNWKNVDIAQWNMGKRVEAAPSFEDVIELVDPRSDCIISPEGSSAPSIDQNDVVQMSDQFYLKSPEGKYIAKKRFWSSGAAVGSARNKIPIQFVGGSGKIMNGSFVMIESNDPSLGVNNLLESIVYKDDCQYSINKHIPGQWWTIKSIDSDEIGAEIHYGDKVYLENHCYLNPLIFVPGRLTYKRSIFYNYLTKKSVTEEGSDACYWIIEKP